MEATTKRSGEKNWEWWVLGGILAGVIGFGIWVFFKLNQIQDTLEKLGKRKGNGVPEDAVIEMTPTASTETALAPSVPVDSQPEATFRYSEDFRTVYHLGHEHHLTLNQARIAQKLWEAKQNKTPELHQSTLLEDLGIYSKRLRDVFKNCTAFGSLIVGGEKKGLSA